MPPALSVVLPAYNEERLLPATVGAVVAGLSERGGPFEVIIVENGSTDATRTVAERLAAEHPEVQARSWPAADYGASLRAGFLAATGDVVVNFDVDFADLDFLDRAVPLVAAAGGPVIVVGSKRSPGAVDTRPWPRRFVTSVFSLVLRRGFGLRVSDTHGIKALRRAPLVPLVEACRFGTDLFDTELILRAEHAGLAVSEVPVTVQELRPARTSIARRAARSVIGLVRLRLALARERRA